MHAAKPLQRKSLVRILLHHSSHQEISYPNGKAEIFNSWSKGMVVWNLILTIFPPSLLHPPSQHVQLFITWIISIFQSYIFRNLFSYSTLHLPFLFSLSSSFLSFLSFFIFPFLFLFIFPFFPITIRRRVRLTDVIRYSWTVLQDPPVCLFLNLIQKFYIIILYKLIRQSLY